MNMLAHGVNMLAHGVDMGHSPGVRGISHCYYCFADPQVGIIFSITLNLNLEQGCL